MYLKGALKDEAKLFAQNYRWKRPGSYHELRSALREHYRLLGRSYLYQLQQYKRGNRTVAKYG